LLLGVSGGIAAYKALETARLAVKAGHSVRVLQTEASLRFVGAASFAAITGAPVLTDEFEPDPMRGAYPGEPAGDRVPISHLALVEHADLYLIAPAGANTIAKLAHGHADNLLSTAALAAPCPVLLAPAMNNRMYAHAATQANLELLKARGVTIIGPGTGELASHGECGVGRMAEPEELLAACESRLRIGPHPPRPTAGSEPQPWLGVRVLVTAGGTREPIDSVRFIGNRSSGRMGFALAEQAARRGAEVKLVAANVALSPPAGVELIEVTTAAELAAACIGEFGACDVLLMAAAVADFRPREPAQTKLKKDRGAPRIELEPTEDVLSLLVERRRAGQVLVGFAAEHGDGAIAYGAQKLERKGLDAIVINDISKPGIGFDAAENEVTILVRGGGERGVAKASKARVAQAVLDEVETLRAGKESNHRTVRTDPFSAAGV
jgi:phosphopantothenoylcysteine decarboxylase/phosphopantothenate--cysteine ligase